jgi:hypothetical protein
MGMEYVVCNLCGQDETRPWGNKDGLRIVQCKHCGLIYTNPRLDDQALAAYYNVAYFDDRSAEADPRRYKMYQIEVEDMARTIEMKGKFLDVGCANGIFLTVLPNSLEKHGIEFSPQAAELGRKTFGLNIEVGSLNGAPYPEEYFDIVHTLRKTGFEPVRWIYPYWNTPYAQVVKDHFDFVVNYLTGKESPAFWRSVMTVYARKR